MQEHTDPVRGFTEPDRYWTTANVGEAATDVMTPLCFSAWSRANELGGRRSYAYFGVGDDSDVTFDEDQNKRITGVFYGRVAMNMDVILPLSGRLPGVTAHDFELAMTGTAREGLPEFTSDPERTALIEQKSAKAVAEHHDLLTRSIEETERWWRDEVYCGNRSGSSRERLAAAQQRFEDTLYIHINTRFLHAGTMGRIYALAGEAGRVDLVPEVLAAFGDIEETQLGHQLRRVAHGELAVDAFLERFGFHGTHEGNPSGRSWREDPAQLDTCLKGLADRPLSDGPDARAQAASAKQREAVETLCRALPDDQAAALRAEMQTAAEVTRDTERGKGAFLMAIDGIRAAARDLGRELVDADVIDDVDDVFFFTLDELLVEDLPGARETVSFRRGRWEEYRTYSLPTTFTGMPEPILERARRAEVGEEIAGVPGSSGVCEGRVRVVDDPTTAALTDGDVLVCRMTDPSWTPLFMLADGLVIDIGGLGSHGAIVAREMGIPCVINTGDGTQRLGDGDLVRVDGNAGVVTVLEQVAT